MTPGSRISVIGTNLPNRLSHFMMRESDTAKVSRPAAVPAKRIHVTVSRTIACQRSYGSEGTIGVRRNEGMTTNVNW